MYNPLTLFMAGLVYKYAFFIYQPLYFFFKNRQDRVQLILFQKWLNPGDTAIDIGANIGSTSLALSKFVSERGKVISFEPENTNYHHLTKLCQNLKNIALVHAAVGNTDKNLKIYTSKLLNVDHHTYATQDFGEVYSIPCTRLDRYLKTNRITQIKLVKIDVQGFEYEVLSGMKNTIAHNRNLIIFMEFWPHGQNERKITLSKLISLINSLHLSIYIIRQNQIQKLQSINLTAYAHYTKYDFDNWILSKRPLTKL